MKLWLAFCVALVGVGGTAGAAPRSVALQGPAALDKALDEPAAPVPAGGERYVGVAPPPGPSARNPLPAPRGKTSHLIWSGFQGGEGGGSKVFFQTNQAVTFEVAGAGARKAGKPGEMSVFLKNCRIHLRNNGRNLDTRFFATPVAGVTAIQRHKDVELRISLKEPVSVTPHTEPGPDGTQFIVLEFPPAHPDAPEAR
jgi:hypothetical protein